MATPLRVLIVEDSENDSLMLTRELRRGGYEPIHERVDSLEAMKASLDKQWDIVLSDYSMPHFRGTDALLLLREKNPDIPFIYVSGTMGEDMAVAAMKAGANDYVIKGNLKRLIPAIRRELQEAETRRERMRLQEERDRLFEETKRNLERIRALHEIDMAITSTLDLRAVLDVLLEKIDLFLPYAAATTIRLFNREAGLLEPVACRNLIEEEWRVDKWKSGRGLANVVFKTKAPVKIGNVQTDPRTRDPAFFRRYGLISYLGVPLIAKGGIVGVLSFYTKEERQFSNGEVEFLSTLAGQAAIAIQNAQLYKEMTNLAGDLAKSNRVKDEFLSVMSHELRTPLNVVVGYTGMIMDGLLGEINEKQKEAMEKVINRANDQLVLVNNILYATVLETEKINVESQVVVLGDFLNQLKSTYDTPLHKELVLKWECSSPLSVIQTDGTKLKHILQNLINNAIKFTDNGSITISAGIKEGSRQQAIGNRKEGSEATEDLTNALCLLPNAPQVVEFKVADTGVGIPKDALSFVFDKFRQVDSSETRLYGGVGMGLYIVKKFTELLGGTVQVKSEPDKGSTFTVTLPCGK